MDFQTEFINKIQTTNKNIQDIIANEIKNISYENITDEVIDTINLNIINIYIEFLADDIIEHKFINHDAVKCSKDKLYIYLIYYHPKLFEYVFSGNTINDYNKHRQNMLSLFDGIQQQHNELTSENKDKLVNVKRLLEMEINNDITTLTCFEYGYYFTWASYKRDFVDIHKDKLLKNNSFDILALNVRWNMTHNDAIVMYNNIEDMFVPVLNTDMINKTKRFNRYPLINTPTGPYSLYDKNMKPIDKLTTDNICVVFDYGNNYYTKLFVGNNEITLNFANAIIDRKIIPNYNKRLLHNIINRDIYSFLPSTCYENKLDNSSLNDTINKFKKIVMDSFTPKAETTINNILTHSLFKSTLTNKHDREIFKVYISYINMLDHFDMNTLIDMCVDYIDENMEIYTNTLNK